MRWSGVVIFLVTYLLVSARRVGWLGLDRPAAALLGAVACVAAGVLSPDDALAAVDGDTLLLLMGVMGMGAFLVVDGFFEAVEARLAPLTARPARLLGAIVWGAGGLAALITNDAVCLLGAPLVVRLTRRGGLPPVPYLLALATAANTGSAATLVGNPQNMLCGQLGDLGYLAYLKVALPVALLGLAVNHGVLAWVYRRGLGPRAGGVAPAEGAAPTGEALPRAPVHRAHWTTLAVIAGAAVTQGLGAPLPWAAVGGFTVLMLVHRRDTTTLWAHIDWTLLLFFAGLFVVVEGLRASGATAWLFARFPLSGLGAPAPTAQVAGFFVLGSNLMSNVPFILVIQEQLSAGGPNAGLWTLLALASTFAGNLTLLGSAANVIVAEAARGVGGFGFFEHLRVGLPIAVITTALSVVWLALFPV